MNQQGKTDSEQTARVILVGGFLGAGKTTLLYRVAGQLTQAGKRVGLITNDQAPDLMDTALLARGGFEVREVSGSCFCCNFQALLHAAREIRDAGGVDAILSEPVGSCTDLSATILQPLKDRFGAEFVPSPFTVLADPDRLETLLGKDPESLHPMEYILWKQFEEADWIAVNKVDTIDAPRRERLRAGIERVFPGRRLWWISAQTGEGVSEWLAAALEATGGAGQRIVEVDYDVYAEGEAALGWLNASASLKPEWQEPVAWTGLARDLLERMRAALRARGAEVGHIKLLLSANGAACEGHLIGLDQEPVVSGEIPAGAPGADLIFNARAKLSPGDLETLTREALWGASGAAGAKVELRELRSFAPGRPNPTYRYDRVVGA